MRPRAAHRAVTRPWQSCDVPLSEVAAMRPTAAPTFSPQADELLAALARMDAVLQAVRRAAGQGSTPELERELLAQLRCLRALLGAEAAAAAEDVVDAARRALDAAEPEAPLLVLAMAQRTLAALIRRQAAAQRLASAA